MHHHLCGGCFAWVGSKFPPALQLHPLGAPKKFFTAHRRRLQFVLLFVFVLAVGASQAANKTWDGEGADSFWQTGANWDPTGGGGTAPVLNDSLFFDGFANTTAINDFSGNALFKSITFNTTASHFTLNGNPVLLNNTGGSAIAQNIGGSITNNSATNLQTILFITILADGKHLIVNNGAGRMALGGVYRGLSISNGPTVVH